MAGGKNGKMAKERITGISYNSQLFESHKLSEKRNELIQNKIK